MNAISILGAIIALCAYAYLAVCLIKGDSKQNLASWLLWAVLDGLAAATLIVQNGNYLLPAAYAAGSLMICICIIKSTSFQWTWFETLVSSLVGLCIVVWYHSGPKTATIVSSLAMCTAGIPQLIETWKKPWDTPTLVWVSYTVANGLGILAGKDWSVEERFYVTSACVYCVILISFASRNIPKPEPVTLA